jgi:hypothetical protein
MKKLEKKSYGVFSRQRRRKERESRISNVYQPEWGRQAEYIREQMTYRYYPPKYTRWVDNAINSEDTSTIGDVYYSIDDINDIVDKLDQIDFPDCFIDTLGNDFIDVRHINDLQEYADKIAQVQMAWNKSGAYSKDSYYTWQKVICGNMSDDDKTIINNFYEGKQKIEYY